MKDVIGRKLGAFGKTGVGTSELEWSAFLIFLFFWDRRTRHSRGIICGIFQELSGKNVHLNRSSEQKAMPVLRRTLRIRFCCGWIGIGCESGGGNKCGNDDSGKGKYNQTKTPTKPPTKTQTRTQTQHYGLWNKIMQTAKHGLGRS
jgi:hypothetical protein